MNKELKQNETQEKQDQSLELDYLTHETRNHHLVLCRQSEAAREECAVRASRDTTRPLPKRARRGVENGAMRFHDC